MSTAAASAPLDDRTYRRRVFSWTMYDWANSAFATTILAAVLPIYFSTVAGSTLPSEAAATGWWSFSLSVSLFIAAIMSPILGTVSDVVRGKKRFLTIFALVGILGTAALVFVGTGDWMLAAILAIIGRIGFSGSISFYDALLPHVAKEQDQDRVSAQGYAMGYLGGGILLAINIAIIFLLDDFALGSRIAFLSVAIWWAVFSLPLLTQVPEPPAAVAKRDGQNVISASFKRIWDTLKDIAKYRELLKFLIAFLIYNDAIGTIIGVAAIYGAELGFGSIELILALLLVQFVGIPFSLIFGSLPNPNNKRRAFLLVFILFNLVALPSAGIIGARVLPQDMTGVLLPPYESTANGVGTGTYGLEALDLSDDWMNQTISAAVLSTDADVVYASSSAPAARVDFAFNGQNIVLTYGIGPDHGIWAVLLDGQPLLEEGDNDQMVPVVIDAYHITPRYNERVTLTAPESGEHVLSLVNTGTRSDASTGNVFSIAQVEVLSPVSRSSLPVILGCIIVVQAIGLLVAFLLRGAFAGLAARLDTKRTVFLALIVYSAIAVWGFFLGSTIEFWFLAWMVAIVQGGSQALSRSLFSIMSPASKSGEFFGLFGVMEKFASFIGPLIFAAAALTLGSSRPAILSLIAFFIIGGFLLLRVDVEAGRTVAQEEDREALSGTAS
ncbi:MAG: MFS transporter [Chloroflexi bacterium]|nr:MFS transporter [Chloroflexota bacterium]